MIVTMSTSAATRTVRFFPREAFGPEDADASAWRDSLSYSFSCLPVDSCCDDSAGEVDKGVNDMAWMVSYWGRGAILHAVARVERPLLSRGRMAKIAARRHQRLSGARNDSDGDLKGRIVR